MVTFGRGETRTVGRVECRHFFLCVNLWWDLPGNLHTHRPGRCGEREGLVPLDDGCDRVKSDFGTRTRTTSGGFFSPF